MQAPYEMTEGLERLKSILAELPVDSAHWNEAQNRFQFIDRLLTECLGWERPDLEVEVTHEGGGRADYLLGNPCNAVLEAKKESKLWETIPVGHSGLLRKIKPLMAASKNFSEVVTQVIPYCSLNGASIAVVCNGPQLAIFQAITIGQKPLEGDCYFFDGFTKYIQEFVTLWTLLSPEGITENRAKLNLARYRNPRLPVKASQSISEPNKYRYRDLLQEELRTLSSLLLEEIEDNPDLRTDFYRDCYVPIEANNRHLLLSKQIIDSRYRRVGDDGISPASVDSMSKASDLTADFSMGVGSRPIVVVGDVGVGKSSFFENLFLNIIDVEGNDTIFININLGVKATLSSDIKTYVLQSIPDVLSTSYGIDIFSMEFVNAIYFKEIQAFDRSVEGALKDIDHTAYQQARIKFLKEKTLKSDSHLHASLGHLSRGRNKRIILVLDNADQRTFEVQQEAFLIAQELAATRNLFVFIALRPSTFFMSKTTGALSAYHSKLLTISPPPADEVIQRRLTFALRIAEGKAVPASLDGIRFNLQNIAAFLRATLRSVKSNEQIKQFLGNITGGNTRSVIELITSFCGSPNVDARKIVDIEIEKGNYVVPLHEFTKHALLGEFSYYNPQSSLFACNMFDVSEADSREHFLSNLIVGYVSSNLGKRDNDGYVRGEAIIRELSRLGFIENQVIGRLATLANKRILETPHSHFREIELREGESPEALNYRATSIGLYHIKFWVGSFAFLDAMSIDTPIFDEAVRDLVCSLAPSFEISARYEKTVAFRRYLEEKWHQSSFDTSYYNLPAILTAQAHTFELVERVAMRRSDNRNWRARPQR
jgi:GTPase SAR1 family protein